jgi:hypothetical protein
MISFWTSVVPPKIVVESPRQPAADLAAAPDSLAQLRHEAGYLEALIDAAQLLQANEA